MSKKDLLSAPSKGGVLATAAKFATENYIPLYCTIELNLICNFSCLHCYNFDRTNLDKKSKNLSSLSFSEVTNVIDQFDKLGCLYLALTGGEPLLHPDILSIVAYGKSKNMLVRLKTNGFLVDEKMAANLVEYGLGSVDLSCYGFSDRSYEAFTGNKRGFSYFKRACESLLQVGIIPNISIILHRYNANELGEMISYCERLNIPYFLSDEITHSYDGVEKSSSVGLSSEQMIDLYSGEYRDKFVQKCEVDSFQCSCARTVLAVASNGNIYPCIGAPIKVGSIFEDDIVKLWTSSPTFKRIRGLKDSDFKDCSSCDLTEFCTRSSGTVFANTGNYTGCEPDTYKRAKLKREIFERH